LQNSEEAELKRINQKCTIDREELRLNLIVELQSFGVKFGLWSTREYAEHSDRMGAAVAALDLVNAALRGDEGWMKDRLNKIAWDMRYRLQEGRFED
jgi:hypothetical protein